MSEAAKTARIVEDEVARVLGGRRTSSGPIHVPLAPGYTGHVGLGRATQGRPKGWIAVLVTVGVRHDETARIARALLNQSSGQLQATWSQGLSYLVPGTPLEWTFGPDVDREVLDDLCNTLRVSGMPILQASLSLEAILERLGRHPLPAGVQWNLPIVLALLGRHDEARAAVASELEWLRPRTYDGTLAYTAFAERFERWLEERISHGRGMTS